MPYQAKRSPLLHYSCTWQSGEALPSEHNLVENLSVSRITARKALERLVEMGLFVVAKGLEPLLPRALINPCRGYPVLGVARALQHVTAINANAEQDVLQRHNEPS